LIDVRRTITGPDFVILGAQRGGTTSLYHYLLQHPRIAAAAVKETHFATLFYDRGQDWYRAQFPPDLPAGHITGEATPYYLFHPLAPRRLQQHAPRAKLIVLLRNPVDRAYSHYHLELARGDEQRSFEDAIAREEERLAGEVERLLEDETYYSFAHQHHTYLARGCYVDQIERWFAIFPREQFLIVQSEALYRDPTATFSQITDFLGLPAAPLINLKAYNDRSYPPLPLETRQRLSTYFAEKDAALTALLDQSLSWPG
jgi:hypothetical protein